MMVHVTAKIFIMFLSLLILSLMSSELCAILWKSSPLGFKKNFPKVYPSTIIFSLFIFKYLVYLDLTKNHICFNFILFYVTISCLNPIHWIVHVLPTTLTYTICHKFPYAFASNSETSPLVSCSMYGSVLQYCTHSGLMLCFNHPQYSSLSEDVNGVYILLFLLTAYFCTEKHSWLFKQQYVARPPVPTLPLSVVVFQLVSGGSRSPIPHLLFSLTLPPLSPSGHSSTTTTLVRLARTPIC